VVQFLSVRVYGDKFHILNFGTDHMVDRIIAGIADSDYFYPRESFYFRIDFCHIAFSLAFLIF